MTARIFVGNLGPDMTSEQLRELFVEAGGIESCRVIVDRISGVSRGFAFIEMATAEAARNARTLFNGYEHEGKTLKVNEAKVKF
ncbi:MAG: RNA recognition motif domain-containing protein [Blastocatellia bacterium]